MCLRFHWQPIRKVGRVAARVIALGCLVCIKQRGRHLKKMPLLIVAPVRYGSVGFRFVAPALMDATNCCRMFIIVTWISSCFPVPVPVPVPVSHSIAAASTVRGGVTTHSHTHSHLCPDSHAHAHTLPLCGFGSELEHFIYGILSLRDGSSAERGAEHIGMDLSTLACAPQVAPLCLGIRREAMTTATATALPSPLSLSLALPLYPLSCFVHGAVRFKEPAKMYSYVGWFWKVFVLWSLDLSNFIGKDDYDRNIEYIG